MNHDPIRRSFLVRVAGAATAACVTAALFTGVVSLADDHPMAIAGQPSAQMLARLAPATKQLAAASAPDAPGAARAAVR